MTQEYSVEVQSDFLERQTKAPPVVAVAELIWNSLDADATDITVDFENDKLGGISKIIVSDNGDGIPYAEAPTLFRNLGGSWKKTGAHTKRLKHMLHGQEGRGRFKGFALGSVIDWKVASAANGKLFRYDITIIEREIRKVRIGEEKAVKRAPTGVQLSSVNSNAISRP